MGLTVVAKSLYMAAAPEGAREGNPTGDKLSYFDCVLINNRSIN